jgi:MraZ protein
MFRGINALLVDTKGRMAMPARYRDALQAENGSLVVTIDTDAPCLLLYPLPEWNVIESKLAALPSFNAAARRIQRLLIGHATDVELDNNGRLLIPPVLREYASLDKKVMLVGQGKKFEIWSELGWQEQRDLWFSGAGKAQEELPLELQQLSL